MKILKTFLIFLLSIYILACVGLYFIQDKIIFAPQAYPNSEMYPTGTELEIPLTKKLSMNALLLSDVPGKRSEKVLLYFHGNKGNIRRAIYQTRVMRNSGMDIMIIDYRGYGKTEGSLVNDAQMLSDADKAYEYLMTLYDRENIYVLGYSLGSGMASYVASQHRPAHLFLVAPFTSLVDIKDKWLWMFPDFLMKYRLDNMTHLKSVNCDVTIVHGTRDEIVDFSFSKKLLAEYPKINLIKSEGTGHRRIIFDSLLGDAIRDVVSR